MSGNINSLIKAMRILDIMAIHKRPLSLQEITNLSGYPKSTVHGLLSTMRQNNYVTQTDYDGKYMLGVRLFEIGNCVSESWDIISVSKPYMNNIAIQTCESVNIGTINNNEILILSQLDTGTPLRVVAGIGAHLPLHSTSLGKVIIANMDFSAVKSILNKSELISYTPHTIVEIDKIKEELENIRNNGYAIENGENRIGLRSVAAPIFNAYGKIAYSISVSGMYRSIYSKEFELAKKLVIQSASSISKDLGFISN